MAGAAISTRGAGGVTLRAWSSSPAACNDRTGDDLGLAEFPVGWELAPGDVRASEAGRLVRVVELLTHRTARSGRGARQGRASPVLLRLERLEPGPGIFVVALAVGGFFG